MICRGKYPMILPSKKYTEWHKDALLQLIGKNKIITKELTLIFYAPDKRLFDLTNKAESIMDTLVDAELLEDDNYSVISSLNLRFGGIEKGQARCEIEYK